jgi:hypothetical protein
VREWWYQWFKREKEFDCTTYAGGRWCDCYFFPRSADYCRDDMVPDRPMSRKEKVVMGSVLGSLGFLFLVVVCWCRHICRRPRY